MIPITSPPMVAAAEEVKYAGFWLRFVAHLIDSVPLFFPTTWVVMILVVLIRLWLPGQAASDPPARSTSDAWLVFLNLLPALIFLFGAAAAIWLYYAVTESSAWQATPGKKLMGLYVTDMEGHKISFGRATGRFLGRIVSNFTLLIGYVMAGFTTRKQALHDIMAGCLVRRGRPRGATPP